MYISMFLNMKYIVIKQIYLYLMFFSSDRSSICSHQPPLNIYLYVPHIYKTRTSWDVGTLSRNHCICLLHFGQMHIRPEY